MKSWQIPLEVKKTLKEILDNISELLGSPIVLYIVNNDILIMDTISDNLFKIKIAEKLDLFEINSVINITKGDKFSYSYYPKVIGKNISFIPLYCNGEMFGIIACYNNSMTLVNYMQVLKSYKSFIEMVINKNYYIEQKKYDYTFIEKKYKKNEEKLKLAIEASNAIIWEFDVQSGKIEHSDNLGYILKDFYEELDKTETKIYNFLTRECFRDLKKYVLNFIKGSNKVFDYEMKVTSQYGEEKWFLLRGKVTSTDINNKPKIIMGTAIDVSETKKRENYIKYLAEHDSLTGLYNRMYFEDKLKELDKDNNYPLGIIIMDVDGLKVINDAFGHSMGDSLIRVCSEVITECFETNNNIISRIGGDEFSIIIKKTSRTEIESLFKKLQIEMEKRNVISITPSVSMGYAIKESAINNILSIYKKAEDRMYKSKLLKSTSTRSTIIKSLQKTLQEKTHETEEHCRRIKELSIKIATYLNLDDSIIDDVKLLSSLHDIGKIAIPDNILNKPEKLRIDEWKIMKSHCEIGYRIASSTKDIYSIAEGILSHHERWDGTGYPRNLKGEEIPLIARIISVADTYDAMTNNRVYRKALSHKEAVKEIINCRGLQFDPDIVDVFVSIINTT